MYSSSPATRKSATGSRGNRSSGRFRKERQTRTVKSDDLLARTVLYKVGHHGSHNATLREKGLELMSSSELAAMIPVNRVTAKKMDWLMPFPALLTRLVEKTHGRVMDAERGLDDAAAQDLSDADWSPLHRSHGRATRLGRLHPRMVKLAGVRCRIAAILVAAAATTAPAATPTRQAKLRQLAQSLVRAGAPGAIVFVRAPSATRSAVSGFSNLEPRVPMRASDRFRVASITKTFVATVAATARSRRKARHRRSRGALASRHGPERPLDHAPRAAQPHERDLQLHGRSGFYRRHHRESVTRMVTG